MILLVNVMVVEVVEVSVLELAAVVMPLKIEHDDIESRQKYSNQAYV